MWHGFCALSSITPALYVFYLIFDSRFEMASSASAIWEEKDENDEQQSKWCSD
jgi:hypothetical protein